MNHSITRKNLRFIIMLLTFTLFVTLHCSSPVAGGGTRGGNPVVYGKVTDAEGNNASKVVVRVFPEYYNPVSDGAIPKTNTDTTDESGVYNIQLPDTGRYSLYAVNSKNNTSTLIKNIILDKDTNPLPESRLTEPGQISIDVLSLGTAQNGILFIEGTDIIIPLRQADPQLSIAVPSGAVTIIFTSSNSPQESKTVVKDLFVEPGESVNAPADGWTHSRKVFLNTTTSGANTVERLADFPVLIRLNADNFDFTTARFQGEDIRFTRADGTQLPYEIESWDAMSRKAAIWVKVDEILPQNSSQHFLMIWGKKDCTDASDGSAVFETAQGYQGVYHLAEQNNAVTVDATANKYNGTSTDMVSAEGIAGRGQIFNGTSSFIVLDETASSKLDFPHKGHFTISLWINADSVESNRQIIGKGNYQYHLKLQEYNWAFNDYSDLPSAGWHYTKYPFTKQTWTHLAGVRNDTAMYLYVNGECVDSILEYNSDTLPRNTSFDVEIGRRSEIDGRKAWFFQGMMDQIEMSDVPRKPEWIRLSYLNQKGELPFVRFGH